MSPRIVPPEPATEHCEGPATGGEASTVGGGIDPHREPAHDGHPAPSEVRTDPPRDLQAIVGGPARPHDRNPGKRRDLPVHEEASNPVPLAQLGQIA